jgi:hypothetical protein
MTQWIRRPTSTSVTCVHSPFYATVTIVTRPYQSSDVDWTLERGREAYHASPRPPTYAPAPKLASKPPDQRYLLGIRGEERIGGLLAGAGAIWATYVATMDYASLWRMQIMPPGPVEICALGILVWIHAKWRRSTKAN